MNLQKEKEAFEAWLFREYPDAIEFMIVYKPDENIYEHRPTQVRWEAWQAAKAQAIPDGYVLMPKEPTEEMIQAGRDERRDLGTVASTYKAMIEAQEQAND